MSDLYRGMDQAALDVAYDNWGPAGGAAARAQLPVEWLERSRSVVAAANPRRDLRYGEGVRQRLDFFSTDRPGAPTLAFIHGGYWRANEKEIASYLAAGPLARGLNFANLEYTLAPAVRMDAIVGEIKRAVAWLVANLRDLGGDSQRLYLSGHSAGGHLTAMAIGEPGVRGGLTVSGLFDLEPIRLTSMNKDIRLDADEALRNSPRLHLPSKAPPLIVAYGTKERPELCRQSNDYHAAWTARGLTGRLLPLDGHHHFSVLDELAAPDGALMQAVLDLIART